MMIGFDDHDTCVVGHLAGWQCKTVASINHCHHVTTQVNDSKYISGSARYLRNISVAQHFLDLHNVNAVGFAVKTKRYPLQYRIVRSEEHTSELQSRPHL